MDSASEREGLRKGKERMVAGTGTDSSSQAGLPRMQSNRDSKEGSAYAQCRSRLTGGMPWRVSGRRTLGDIVQRQEFFSITGTCRVHCSPVSWGCSGTCGDICNVFYKNPRAGKVVGKREERMCHW